MSTPRYLCLTLSLLASACGSDDASSTVNGLTMTTSTTQTTTMSDSTTDAMTMTGDGDGDGDGAPTGDGDGAPTDEGYCGHQCSVDADCFVDGMDLGLQCTDNLCQGGSSSCTNDDECVALLSGWTAGAACTPGGGECDLSMMVCLDVGGSGHCAIAPSQFIMCSTLLMEEIQVVDIDGNPATVCGKPDAMCTADAYCLDPCQSDADCPSAAYPVCNLDTGICACSSDQDCATIGQSQFSVCNDGVCGCGSDQDCLAGNAGDVCTSLGFCGCSDDAACANVPNQYDGGMIACVPVG